MKITFDMEESSTPEPEWNFSAPEDVIFLVFKEGDNLVIDFASTILREDGVAGAASYEQEFGFLEYTIEDLETLKGEGWWVMEGVTGEYHKGDGYTSDDDMNFYFDKVRPATQQEIDEYS